MTERQAKEEMLKATLEFPETFKLVSISYEDALITITNTGSSAHFSVFVPAWPHKLNTRINNTLCSKAYLTLDDVRIAVDKAFKDSEVIEKSLKDFEEDQLTTLGYKD